MSVIFPVFFLFFFQGLHLRLDLQVRLIISCVELRSAESSCAQSKTLVLVRKWLAGKVSGRVLET